MRAVLLLMSSLDHFSQLLPISCFLLGCVFIFYVLAFVSACLCKYGLCKYICTFMCACAHCLCNYSSWFSVFWCPPVLMLGLYAALSHLFSSSACTIRRWRLNNVLSEWGGWAALGVWWVTLREKLNAHITVDGCVGECLLSAFLSILLMIDFPVYELQRASV